MTNPAQNKRSTRANTTGSATGTTPPNGPTRALNIRPGAAPLYQQIANDLRMRIESGDLPVGAVLPSESAVKALYGVSVPTFRQAVQQLAAEGRVITSHGRPTKVAPRQEVSQPVVFEFDPPNPTPHDGFRDWSEHGWQQITPADHELVIAARHAHALKVEAFTDVLALTRHLEHTSGLPAIHRVVVPVATGLAVPELQHDPFRLPAELYLILTVAGHQLDWHTSTTAQTPTMDDTAALNLPEGVPVLVHTRVTLNAEHQPLALEETRLPADRVRVRNH